MNLTLFCMSVFFMLQFTKNIIHVIIFLSIRFFQYFFSGFKMASRYVYEYFFQHTLMNVSFRKLNEIIHLNAGNIPEYIRHYASAAFVNGDFWNDLSKIEENMKFKAYHTDYILSYMNYVKMQCTIYNLVTKGKFSIVCTFFIYKKINIRHFSHILLIYCKNTIPLFAFKTASSDDFLSI